MPTEPLAVTWSANPNAHHLSEVRRVAAQWNLPIYERARKGNLGRQLGSFAEAFLVRSGRGWRLEDRQGVLEVSPGIAMLRRKRLAAELIPDRLLQIATPRRGETIVDATLGQAADARVLATAIGREGTVIGLEASRPLAIVMAEGLPLEEPWPDTAPIEVVHADAASWLLARDSKSVDLVYFDPMFERSKTATAAFAHVRRYAVKTQVTKQTIAAARRVARRLVLMKSDDPRVFPELGLEAVEPESNSAIYWGVCLP